MHGLRLSRLNPIRPNTAPSINNSPYRAIATSGDVFVVAAARCHGPTRRDRAGVAARIITRFCAEEAQVSDDFCTRALSAFRRLDLIAVLAAAVS